MIAYCINKKKDIVHTKSFTHFRLYKILNINKYQEKEIFLYIDLNSNHGIKLYNNSYTLKHTICNI